MQNNKLQPKLSISIITYNHELFIEECLESLIHEKCNFNFEIVIGEDYSTDRTKEIIQEYERRYPDIIVPIYQTKNVGWQQNLIDVINRCSGEYIAHLDGDDAVLSGKLQKQVDFLDHHKECSMVFHNMKFIGENIVQDSYNNPLEESTCIMGINDFVSQGLAHWCNSSKVYRKSSLNEIEYLKNLHCIGDQYLHLQSANKGAIGYISEVLGLYRKHENGFATLNKQKDRIACALNDLVLTYSHAYVYGVKKELVDRQFAFIYFDVACQYLVLKDYKNFKLYIEKSHENNIFFNKKHKLCFTLREMPVVLHGLKLLNTYLNNLRGKHSI
ncbi:glycosyltransferase [bacterium]|nr:glycosyltransferase [bacterium]MBU1433415.1 glycosyltransferase [bacterium]